MQRYILIGDSGHSKVITDCIESTEQQVIAKLDDKYQDRFVEDGFIKGPISLVHELLIDDVKVIIGIGSNVIRKLIAQKLQLKEDSYGIIAHKSSIVSNSAVLGYGTVVMPGVVINAGTTIGKHCIINTSAVVEHDSTLENFVHISPNATLTGGVTVLEGTQIGAAAVAIPGVTVGKWSRIGAGATIIHDLPNNITAVGSPAKVIKKEETKNE